MSNQSELRRQSMPDYPVVKWDGVKITSHPVGWRFAIPVLRMALKKVPYFSGSEAVFCVHIKADSDYMKDRPFDFEWYYSGPGRIGNPPGNNESVNLDKTRTISVRTPTMIGFGDGSFRFTKRSFFIGPPHGHRLPPWTSRDVIGLDVKSSDTLMMVIFTLVATSIIAVLGAWFGAWAGQNLLQSDEPIPVRIIVEEPASQSGRDSNEQ